MNVKINELIKYEVEQIKVSGSLIVAGKTLNFGVNTTLDVYDIAQLPQSVVDSIARKKIGASADMSAEEISALAASLVSSSES